MKFGTGALFHKTLSCGCEFHKTQIRESQTLLKTFNTISQLSLLYFAISFVKFGTVFIHVLPLSNREFHKFDAVTYILTYSTEQSRSWEANCSAASKEIPRNDIYPVLQNVNKILSYVLFYFCSFSIIRYRCLLRYFWLVVNFMKMAAVKAILHLGVEINFCPIIPVHSSIWVTFYVRHLQVI